MFDCCRRIRKISLCRPKIGKISICVRFCTNSETFGTGFKNGIVQRSGTIGTVFFAKNLKNELSSMFDTYLISFHQALANRDWLRRLFWQVWLHHLRFHSIHLLLRQNSYNGIHTFVQFHAREFESVSPIFSRNETRGPIHIHWNSGNIWVRFETGIHRPSVSPWVPGWGDTYFLRAKLTEFLSWFSISARILSCSRDNSSFFNNRLSRFACSSGDSSEMINIWGVTHDSKPVGFQNFPRSISLNPQVHWPLSTFFFGSYESPSLIAGTVDPWHTKFSLVQFRVPLWYQNSARKSKVNDPTFALGTVCVFILGSNFDTMRELWNGPGKSVQTWCHASTDRKFRQSY